METEKNLVEFICGTEYGEIPQEAFRTVKKILITVFGTTIAGSAQEGCDALVEFYRAMGGKEESTILIHGGKVPTQNAVTVNSVMARALDFDDAMAPGIHIGSSAVPTALGASELSGGCNGKDFLTALVVGIETAARLNLTESAYDGFDPTGVCTVFATTAIACRILGLVEHETTNALALAFNRSGGSFQSNIDGSLAVRVIQGWVSQSGILCSQLAGIGITGPKNFLEGVYGYFHLFGRDMFDPRSKLSKLGEHYELQKILFKKFPSCGLSLGSTEALLELRDEKNFNPEDVERIEVTVPPYAHKLVGHQFELGDNPRVNAQFSIQYCVANALIRQSSKLSHFEETNIKDPIVAEMIKKIFVIPDPLLDQRGHTALDMKVVMASGEKLLKKVEIAPGFPGNPLTPKDHESHFWDCIDASPGPFPREKAQNLLKAVDDLEEMKDVRELIPLLLK